MNEINKIFANNLKKLLAESGMSQTELADKLNVSQQSVSSWVSGKTVPRMGKIEELSILFNVSKSEIIEPFNIIESGDNSENNLNSNNETTTNTTNNFFSDCDKWKGKEKDHFTEILQLLPLLKIDEIRAVEATARIYRKHMEVDEK